MFLRKTAVITDTNIIWQELEIILANYCQWQSRNQIGVNYRPGAENIWLDNTGSLYDRQENIKIGDESDFTEWALDSTNYIRSEVQRLSERENFKIGRVRFMRLLPKTGLSVHYDEETRYHLVLQTNMFSYIAVNRYGEGNYGYNTELKITSHCYHIPGDNHWYWADTTKYHWVYNGGDTERIHLVVGAR